MHGDLTAMGQVAACAFKAIVHIPDGEHEVEFEEHEPHDDAREAATRDHHIRSAYIHVMACGSGMSSFDSR
jgi:energy-converting hydrogenase Eha subunit H